MLKGQDLTSAPKIQTPAILVEIKYHEKDRQ